MIEQMTTSKEDLELINKLTLITLQESDVYTFGFKAIDDTPTHNGRIWTVAWQEAVVSKFAGKPVQLNHNNDITQKVGVIFMAERRDNGIHAKAFIPLITEQDKINKDKIEAGIFKDVSINGEGSTTKQGDLLVIGGGETADIFEVSFVSVPGCRTGCEVTEAIECSEEADPWLMYAKETQKEMVDQYVKFSGFVLGPEIVNRDRYRKIAEQLDPYSLKSCVDDLRKSYETKHKQDATSTEELNVELKVEDAAIRAMQAIKDRKGL